MSSATSSQIPVPADSPRSSLRSNALDERWGIALGAMSVDHTGIEHTIDDDHDMLDLAEPEWTPGRGKSREALRRAGFDLCHSEYLAEEEDIELTFGDEMTNQTTSAENEGISLTVGDSLYEDSDEEESHEDELNDGDNDSTDFDEDGNTAGAAIVGVPGRESEENADWLELFDEGIQDLQSRIDHLQHQDMGLVSRRSGLDPQTSGLIGHMAELVDAESRSNSPPPMSHDLIAPRGRRPSPNPNPTPSALPRFIQHMISRGNRNEQGISAKAIRCLREHEVDKRRKDHKYRYKNGERALLEIEIYQQTTDLLIPRKPFARLVREMASEVGMMGNDIRFTQDALNAIQDAAEKYLTLMFEDAYGLAIYARRVTLKTEDIELLRRMKGPDGEPLLML